MQPSLESRISRVADEWNGGTAGSCFRILIHAFTTSNMGRKPMNQTAVPSCRVLPVRYSCNVLALQYFEYYVEP